MAASPEFLEPMIRRFLASRPVRLSGPDESAAETKSKAITSEFIRGFVLPELRHELSHGLPLMSEWLGLLSRVLGQTVPQTDLNDLEAVKQKASDLHHRVGEAEELARRVLPDPDIFLRDLSDWIRQAEELTVELETLFAKLSAREPDMTRIRGFLADAKETMENMRVSLTGGRPTRALLDINKTVRGAIGWFNAVPQALTIEWSPDPRCPPVLANKAQIKQVVWNLLLNARDAVQATTRGEVRVSTEYREDQRAVIVRFQDNGHGIPPEVLPKVFERGFTTKGDKGSGIGLAVVKDAIESYGGRVEVASETGKGTVFTVTLPVADSDLNPEPGQPSGKSQDKIPSRSVESSLPDPRNPINRPIHSAA